MQRAKLTNELCRELSSACSKPAPKVKKVMRNPCDILPVSRALEDVKHAVAAP